VYYSKRRFLIKDSAPRGRIALPRQQLGAGCSKDGLKQDVPAAMGKWPLHLILHQKNSLSIPRPRLSASARASLPLPISRPFAFIRGLVSSSNGHLGQSSLPKRIRFFILSPNNF
jgi:hypothetical protein